MKSFHYATLPTRANWFQKNLSEHKSDDRANNTVILLCVTNAEIWHFTVITE